MENIENTLQADNLLTINSEIKDYLLETSKWGKLLAIVGYVGMGILLLLGLGIIVGGTIFNSISKLEFPIRVLGFIYFLLAFLYYFPVTYLYKFSYKIKQGLSSNNQLTATSGFESLKSLFKFMGIFTIVILSMYGLLLIIVLPIALFMGK